MPAAEMLLLPLVVVLRSQAADEPAPFLFGDPSYPLEVLDASQKQSLATSDHRRRLGTCHPAADPKHHVRPECRDLRTREIVLTGLARTECLCADGYIEEVPYKQEVDGVETEFTCAERYWVEFDDRDGFLPKFNKTHQSPGICSPGHFFKCSDAPCCWGQCDGMDVNRYYRCYRKKVCVDPGCGCKCGPCWNSHVDCEQELDAAHCNPPGLYPRRFAGCCCENCECENNYASPRVDGCCTCGHCKPTETSTGMDIQCYLDSSAIAAAPAASILMVVAALAVYAV